MNLYEALQQIAAKFDLNIDDLVAYAAEDVIGGRDTHPDQWNAMSVHAAEGQILYALVRALKPQRVLEVGVATGGTSTHILSALATNGSGELHSVDIEPNCGQLVPESLRGHWHLTIGDALVIDLPQTDFIFEDGAHSYEFTRDILKRLKPLGARVIVAHDYFSHEVYGGFGVKQAWDEQMPNALGIKIDRAFTGLGVWANPDWKAPEPMVTEPITPVKPKGKRRG